MFFDSKERAYIAPFGVFLASILVCELISKIGVGYANGFFSKPMYWVYPLQTALCAGLLFHYRKYYILRPITGLGIALLIGGLVFVLWVAPQAWLGFEPRTTGFQPDYLRSQGFSPIWDQVSVLFRFIRLVIVVPLVEEIF